MGPKSRLRALTATKMRGRSPHAHGSPGGGPPRDAARPRALRASHAHRGHAGRSHERVERGDIAVAQRFPSRDLCVHPTREVLEDIAHSLRGREVRAAHRAEQTRELRVELRRVVERVLAALRLDLDELLFDRAGLAAQRGLPAGQRRPDRPGLRAAVAILAGRRRVGAHPRELSLASLGAAASGPGDPVAPCSTNAANSSEQSVRLPATEVPMRLIGLAVLLAVSPSLAPLPVSAQKAERVSRVGYLRSGSVRGWSGAGRRKDREVGEAYGYERPAEDAVCDRSYRRQPHRSEG